MRPRTWTSPFAGRPRIVAWITAVTALGLLLLILAVSVAMRATTRAEINDSIAQEAGEIRRFSMTGVDPSTGQPFATASRFIEVYLERQQAERAELLVGGVRGGPQLTAEERGPEAAGFTELDSATREQVLQPGSQGTVTTVANGVISWQTVDIEGPDTAGFISVIAFHDPQEDRTRAQLGVLVLLALGALVATGVAAWIVSGRLFSHVLQFEHSVAAVADRPTVTRLPEEGNEEYVRLATATNRALVAAEEAAERDRQFAEDLSLEFRTPLAILRGSLEQPGETVAQRDITRHRVLTEVIRMQDVVSDLVVLNRADRPDYVQPTPGLDVEQFAAELVESWQERLGESGHAEMRVALGDVAEGLAAPIDEPRLARVLDEIIKNALHASERGSTVLLGTAVRTDADGRHWAIFDISDTGRGVPEDERALIRERFARASNDPDPGIGLGLAVADRLVMAMRGTVRVRGNDDGPGSTVRVEIPADDQVRDEDPGGRPGSGR